MAAFIFRPQPALDLRRREADAAQLAVAEARVISDRAAHLFADAQGAFEAGSARAAALDAAGGSIAEQALVAARERVKALERLKERAVAAHQERERREEQKAMNELATLRFAIRQRSEPS